MIAVQCPGCRKGIGVQDQWAGKKVQCPYCRLQILIPAAAPAAAAPAAKPAAAPVPQSPPAPATPAAPKGSAPPSPARQAAGLSGGSGSGGSVDDRTLSPAQDDSAPDEKWPPVVDPLSATFQATAIDRDAGKGLAGLRGRLTDLLAPAQGPDELGRLGEYRVLKVLGAGGMGVVFQAEDTRLKRLVALKVMLPGVASVPAARQRFLLEA